MITKRTKCIHVMRKWKCITPFWAPGHPIRSTRRLTTEIQNELVSSTGPLRSRRTNVSFSPVTRRPLTSYLPMTFKYVWRIYCAKEIIRRGHLWPRQDKEWKWNRNIGRGVYKGQNEREYRDCLDRCNITS